MEHESGDQMKRPAIISFGEVLWDLFPDGERLGGASANFACHAAIQGGNVAMASAVGDDVHGRRAIEILSHYGVNVGLIQTVTEAATGTVGVELDSNGKPTFVIHEDSAWDRIAWSDELNSRIVAADAVYFGTLGQRNDASRATIRRAMEVAEAEGISRVLDINLRPPFFDAAVIRESVQLASILKLSDEELKEVCSAFDIAANGPPETTLRSLRKAGSLNTVIMTRSADGALLVTANGSVEQEGVSTTVIDTVGAGDAFMASFIIGELHGLPAGENLRNACEVAAAACTHPGAVPAVEERRIEER